MYAMVPIAQARNSRTSNQRQSANQRLASNSFIGGRPALRDHHPFGKPGSGLNGYRSPKQKHDQSMKETTGDETSTAPVRNLELKTSLQSFSDVQRCLRVLDQRLGRGSGVRRRG